MRYLGPPDQGKGKSPIFSRSNSPPPILRTSFQSSNPRPLQAERDPHLLVVDQVSAALLDGDMDEDSDEGADSSGDEDEEMPDDEDPDNDVTLVQYQEEARREALIRKSAHSFCSSPKKGRMKSEIIGS